MFFLFGRHRGGGVARPRVVLRHFEERGRDRLLLESHELHCGERLNASFVAHHEADREGVEAFGAQGLDEFVRAVAPALQRQERGGGIELGADADLRPRAARGDHERFFAGIAADRVVPGLAHRVGLPPLFRRCFAELLQVGDGIDLPRIVDVEDVVRIGQLLNYDDPATRRRRAVLHVDFPFHAVGVLRQVDLAAARDRFSARHRGAFELGDALGLSETGHAERQQGDGGEGRKLHQLLALHARRLAKRR